MRIAKVKSFLLLGLCISAILANTALVNVGASEQGGFGIPLFWLFIPLVFPFILIDFRYLFWIALVVLTVLFLLLVISNVDYAYSYLTQYVSRFLMFLIFLCFYFFKGINFAEVLKKIHFALTFLAFLSVLAYVLIIFFDFDLGLYNIANNSSFGFRGAQLNEVNGWARQIRLTGVWSEPSYLVIPVMMLIYLNNIHRTRFYWFVNVLSFTIILFSFSRSVWLSIFILIFFSCIRVSKPLTIIFFKLRMTIVTLIFLVGSLSFIIYGSLAGGDSSSTGRVGSAIVGGEMIKSHPLLGMGPSTFSIFKNENEFTVSNVDISNENVIHSAFISIWQQFGIVGCVFFLIPYYLVLKNISYNHFYNIFPYLFSLPAVLVSSGDYTYFSFYWLFLGILNVNCRFSNK
ncbi:O-antigen ligase family protein [Shewanella xiamenensis]|uniref:O-antigen ligase family protein n=1 Tax=Shewanella xiamenensis TaxID=332186 RepID=UPI000849904D|nr:O-antigen ligase family protein [Shewanella xiamenensis]ODR83891.1 hypothetical protein ABT47_00330 [Shewanella xiamenensis]